MNNAMLKHVTSWTWQRSWCKRQCDAVSIYLVTAVAGASLLIIVAVSYAIGVVVLLFGLCYLKR